MCSFDVFTAETVVFVHCIWVTLSAHAQMKAEANSHTHCYFVILNGYKSMLLMSTSTYSTPYHNIKKNILCIDVFAVMHLLTSDLTTGELGTCRSHK
jgi:hypothetical protein